MWFQCVHLQLFWEKNYEMAIMCFEKAGEESWEKRAKASGIRAAAESLHGSNPKEASKMLREAAEIFDSIDRAESAAECFCDLGEYERAGILQINNPPDIHHNETLIIKNKK